MSPLLRAGTGEWMSLRFLIPLCPQAVRFQTFEDGGPLWPALFGSPSTTFPKRDLQGSHLAGISVLAILGREPHSQEPALFRPQP